MTWLIACIINLFKSIIYLQNKIFYLCKLVVHKLNIMLANHTWSISSRLGNHSINGTIICAFYYKLNKTAYNNIYNNVSQLTNFTSKFWSKVLSVFSVAMEIIAFNNGWLLFACFPTNSNIFS